MPPDSTFQSPLSLSLALASSWKHSDLPAGTVKPKHATRVAEQMSRNTRMAVEQLLRMLVPPELGSARDRRDHLR